MGRLTTHVLDTAAGVPARGMRVELYSGAGAPGPALAAAIMNSDGRAANPLLEGGALHAGRYELRFYVAEYYRARGTALPEPPFLDVVVVAFGIADASQHHHVPLLVSPWSYSTYRGS